MGIKSNYICRMKWIYAVLFSFLSLAGILKDLVVFVDFKVNQEYIVMTMCTGVSEPVNTCNGSCYLTTQLKLVHDHGQESHSQVPASLKVKVTYFFEERSEESRRFLEQVESSSSNYLNRKTTQGHPLSIFQPPKYC